MNREPGRFWFFGIRCGCGSFPSWAIPFWRISSRIQSWPTCQKWLLAGRLSKSWYPKILPPTEPWNHLLGFFPTEIPPVTKPTCEDNEGNLLPRYHPPVPKTTRASRTFSHIQKELLLHLHQPSRSRSFEKMASPVYTRYKWMTWKYSTAGLKISPRVRRGVTDF